MEQPAKVKPTRSRVLVTVMTYPHPSQRYQELVCIAGITESGEWVRLYPVDYRYRSPEQQFHKYQWIEIDLWPTGEKNDKRKESRRPDLDTMTICGDPLSAKHDWLERRKIIDTLPHATLNQLIKQYSQNKTSLGIVRPTKIHDLKVKKANGEWKPEWKKLFTQLTLFEIQQKPLRKLPYSFHYVFECADSRKPHTAMCEDWELGVLFLKEIERLGSEKAAADSVKNKFLDELCSPKKDTRFFMGTRFPYNTWLVLGVFWPPKQQPSLFD